MIGTLLLTPLLRFTTLVDISFLSNLNFTQLHFITLPYPLIWLNPFKFPRDVPSFMKTRQLVSTKLVDLYLLQ